MAAAEEEKLVGSQTVENGERLNGKYESGSKIEAINGWFSAGNGL